MWVNTGPRESRLFLGDRELRDDEVEAVEEAVDEGTLYEDPQGVVVVWELEAKSD